jgi:DNA-binding XRE family transcriptional regulator
MNFIATKVIKESKGTLDESALKKVSLCQNLNVPAKVIKVRGRATTTNFRFRNTSEPMITAAQLRAARGLLDWTRADLAKAANISPETVKNIEHGTFRPQEGTAEAIIQAFSAYDVLFTENEGVKLQRDTVRRFEGVDGFKKFMDDVYISACESSAQIGGDKPICVSNVNEKLFAEALGDYLPIHVKRMNALKNIDVRVLVREQDFYTIPEGTYIQYRWNPGQNSEHVPFYVYGDKFSIILFAENTMPQVVVISSAPASKAYREQFEVLWQNSKMPNNNRGK